MRALRDWLGTRLLRLGLRLISEQRFRELLDLIRRERADLAESPHHD